MAPTHLPRGITWGLYFTESEDESLFGGPSQRIDDADLFGEGGSAGGQDDDMSTRTAILARVFDFLGATQLVRTAVHTPADIIAAGHTLCLPFASLTPALGIPGVSYPFNDRFEVIGARVQRPQLVLDCIAYCAHEELLDLCPPQLCDPEHTALRLASRRLRVRLHDNERTPFFRTPLCDLKADKIGKVVVVKGAVIRTSSLRPYVEAMPFECPRCKAVSVWPLPDGRYKPPQDCPAKGCRVKALVPVRSEAVARDFQKVTLQETPEDSGHEELYGRVPRSVEVELLDDLVDSCVPGDHVKVVGMVKSVEVQTDGGGGFGKGASSKPKCMYLLYVEAFAVLNAKAASGSSSGQEARKRKQAAMEAAGEDGGGGSALEASAAVEDAVSATAAGFSVRDLQEISRLHQRWRGKMFEVLAASMCPTIFGHEVVKVGLALGLFGGSMRGFAADAAGGSGGGASLSKRSDIHVLVVGDPGMGKSQMLTAAASLAPRGVYVCGNTTSSSGLTVTVVKDAATGDFALEAGALVMGDQGCCCIDEFDKMSSGEHQALLEAMEQQTISVAKAGIVCSLSARTAVLAAANPVSGHYNKCKTVCENLKLPSNILSRFDLVFV